MKNGNLKLAISVLIVIAASCNEPETIVTDIVHTDGSVTRKIEMRSPEKKFKIHDVQVPYDSTWSIRDSLEIGEKGDTLWVRRAEKVFADADEINMGYKADSSADKAAVRRVTFSKKFRWFHTGYRFAENIESSLTFGYPLSDFLNAEELAWFYSPESIITMEKNGPDSLKYKALSDTISKKTDKWFFESLASEWTGDFAGLVKGKAGKDLSLESLKAHQNDFVKMVEEAGSKFDSLWTNGTILKRLIGESNASKYKTEADTALSVVMKKATISFADYTMRIIMPGRVTGTNGFIDSARVLFWPVKSDYFLTDPYSMWVESKVPNTWAWVVSGLFLLFVFTGIIIRRNRKG
ncbi:MAG: hypothetical protein WCE64_12345 [Bacteroidales bacterium]